jgi:uncharacterized protein YkwD
MADVTAQEQLMLELVNRARLDPQREAARFGIDLNSGLIAGTISAVPKQVLAMNDLLVASARGHSNWMLAADVFDHVGAGGSTPGQRMVNAGYVFSGSGLTGENISWTGVYPGPVDANSAIVSQHRGLFLSSDHRVNLLNNTFREIGIGQQVGNFLSGGTDWSASMITQNFARSGTSVFLTGVVYTDSVNDDFYGIGEGVGGIAINVSGGPGDISSSAGGYEIGLTAGVKTVTFGAVTVQLTVGTTNLKLDLVNGNEIWTNASITNLSGAAVVTLLGIEGLTITGSSANERLTGNTGANIINGGAGNDTIFGNGDNDILCGGSGADVLNGGTGWDFASYASAASGVQAVIYNAAYNTGDAAGDIFTDIEALQGSGFNDVLIGDFAVNGIQGGGGGDWVDGTGTAGDYLYGEAGSDSLVSRQGADVLDGGADFDYARYDYADAGLRAYLYDATQNSGFAAGDTYTSIEGLAGSYFADDLRGDVSQNIIYGLGGADYIIGLGGSDLLIGGDGQDLFHFVGITDGGSGGDAIQDFVSGFDRISVTGAFFGLGSPGGVAIDSFRFVAGTAANLATSQFIYTGATQQLFYDIDGTGAGVQVLLATLQAGASLAATDIIVI